jgi:hypothetical protein
MISWDSGLKCEEARGYYYDCVDGQCEDEIPQTIQMHIGHCDHCREEIQRLGRALKNPSTSDSDEASHLSMVNALLAMHFKYAETPVTCALAKRFLPSMAGSGARITIPTPITVHIEQCSKCRNDWIELQSLNLSDVQLQRLTECIEKRADDAGLSGHQHLSNEQVQRFARVDYADLDAACVEHVCECVPCRKRTLTARQTVASRLFVEPGACQEVSWEDLFDLALPVGFNPLVDEYAQFRKATVDHVACCESCLRRLAAMDQILVNLLPPHECGVVTHFQVVLDETQVHAEVQYEDYPIRIDVQDSPRPCLPEVDAEEATPVSDCVPVHSSRGWMKVAAAAAVVLLGMSISFMVPRAGAGFMDHVYNETTSAPVVHIKTYSVNRPGRTVETWIFQPDIAVTIDEAHVVTAFNASTGRKITRDAAGLVSTITLAGDAKKSLQGRIRCLFDLWSPEMSERAILSSDPSDPYDVYEYRWSEGVQSGVWHASVAQDTQRVVRVECDEGDGKSDFLLKRTFEVDYPRESDAIRILQEKGVDLTGL